MRLAAVAFASVLAVAVPFAARAASVAPTALVDTFVGTSGTPTGGPIDTFPGADVPFGMVQWSPDTPSRNAGGGYEYADRQITGFSLAHLSGPGCSVFGDFAILPAIGDIPRDPANATQPFSHSGEESAPGWYAVSLGNPSIRVELTVTPRTGIGRFTFPSTSQANILFNAASNQAGVTGARVRVDGPNEISGSASSGFFCGMPDKYTVYFVARFDRPFRQSGTWGGGSGIWVSFDATAQRQVLVKVALSFVSAGGARANLAAENKDWDLIAARNRATDRWSAMLGRIAISGGTTVQQRTFYTAFYHTLLHPNLISDVNGLYTGFDGKTHHVAAGHDEYANFSDWDIYRTEVPLLALVAPHETSDMMQSLVDAFRQAGWLPRWALVNGPTSVMGGDSVVPVIAGAYAFGARGFDARSALAGMIKGATSTDPPPAQGWYIERWELHDDYLQRGYVVNTHTTSVAPGPNGASETLEYALDDFSIARLAFELHDMKTYAALMRRSSNWATLFNTASGWIAPRDADGAFMDAPITENGQSGFQEGNAAQYTWMVPQDLRDLIGGMGGTRAAAAKLDGFFQQLNGGPDKPYAWLGNEPSLGAPWVYLTAGEPWRAQEIVRQALATLYDDTPAGLPGNDDLGTMSAWYVWCALGLYPQNPAVRYLDVGAPLFPSIRVSAPGSPTININAPQATTQTPYVTGLSVNGHARNQSWIALPMQGTIRLDLRLQTAPNMRWAIAPDAAPPSYASIRPSFPPSTTATLATISPLVDLHSGGSATLDFEIANGSKSNPAEVDWRVSLPAGLRSDVARGHVTVASGATQRVTTQLGSDGSLRDGYYNARIDATESNSAPLQHVTAAVRITGGGEPVMLAYAANRFGNDVTPIDLGTGATAPAVAVGEEPRAMALDPARERLYVVEAGANSIAVVDTAHAIRVANVRVGSTPIGIAIEPNGKRLWVTNNDDGTIQSIDTASLRAGTPLHVGANPRGLAMAPDGSMLYVSNNGSNSVTPVDLRSGRAGSDIPVGARPAGIAVTPDGKRLYVVDSASNDVTPIDLSSEAKALTPIPVGVLPVEIAISPDGRLAYVANHANSTITPIDLAANRALSPIQVGGAPDGVGFERDGKTAVVILTRDDACVLVDVASGRVSAPIPLGSGPYGVVVP